MNTFAQAKQFVETIEASILNPPRCSHGRAHRIEADQFYCPSCRSIVFEHEFDDI